MGIHTLKAQTELEIGIPVCVPDDSDYAIASDGETPACGFSVDAGSGYVVIRNDGDVETYRTDLVPLTEYFAGANGTIVDSGEAAMSLGVAVSQTAIHVALPSLR